MALWLALACAASSAPKPARITWDRATLRLVQPGGLYGRMVRLRGGALLCAYERAGACWATRSRDDGRTWSAPALAARFAPGAAANPELLQLHSGRLLLFYNERPQDGVHPFAIGLAASADGGATWTERPRVFVAGTEARSGCWEPAALQLPSGEIQLFFANNVPHRDTGAQEITLCRSGDGGDTWRAPETVSFRAGHRDGMPVPLRLQSGDLVIAIEDNGLSGANRLQPAIVATSGHDNWRGPYADAASPRRWGALAPPLGPLVYAGAPYLRQMPGGETVLSCQQGDNDRDCRMTVYVGDDRARDFARPTRPFDLPGHAPGDFWNSLFVKQRDTITAVASTEIGGVRGLWTIDGHVSR
jgi:hypothetical protein